MRRICTGITASLVFTGTLLTLPVYAAPVPAAVAVPVDIQEVDLGSVDEPADGAVVTQDGEAVDGGLEDAPVLPSPAPSTGPGVDQLPAPTGDPVVSGDETAGVPALTMSEPDVGYFETVGVTWSQDPSLGSVSTQIRVQQSDGTWGEWTALEADDAAPVGSAGSTDVRSGTAPYWTGPAQGVEVVVQGEDGRAPEDVRVALIDPGTSAGDTLPVSSQPSATAHAAGDMPRVYTRAEWGADESIRTWDPEYAPTIKAATLHHTADGNDYTATQVPAMMRSIYAFHTQTRGWGDIGYNVIVDRFGRIFEGRYGGLTSTVIGAHAGGFNTSTFGVSMLGNYDMTPVPQATVDAVEAIIAWKFQLYGVDPHGTTVLTSGGGGTSRYAAGVRVTLPTIFGHRDVGSTACPGRYGYARLDEIRDGVSSVMANSSRVLVRTAESGAVFVVSGSSKYLVADLGTLGALAPLGSVGFVSQQYLDRRTTGGTQGRIVLAPSGGVFFIDAGIRLPFGSCAQVADFGGSCDSLVRWDQSLIDAFVAGPSMTSLYRTTSGKTFYVSGGAKREVVDDQALVQAGVSTSGVRLLETGLANLPYGVPVTRDGVVVQVRGGGSPVVASGGGFTQVTDGVRAGSSLAALPVRALDAGSVARLSGVVAVPGALVAGPGGSGVFLLSEAGKRQVVDPAAVPGSPVVVSASFLGLFGDGVALPVGSFVKGAQSSAVYALEGGVRRKVSSWADLVAFAGSVDPVVVSVDQRIVDALPLGVARLPLGALVHSPRSGAVFLVNNARELIPLGSFSVSNELGMTRVVAVSDADVDGYTVRGSGLGTAVDCAGTRYLGLGGRLYSVGSDVADAYRLTFTQLDPLACATLPKAGAPLTRFLRASSGAIYWIENGTKRPFNSYPGYVAAGGTSANTLQVSDFALSQIPTGAPR